MDNCIFCKIVKGELPSKTVEETELFKVVLDVAPATKGHTLIVPKAHYANLYELPEEMAAESMKLAKKLARRMKERLGCEGVNILQNNEEAAGQTVFHYHMHVIPRYINDRQKINWNPIEMNTQELDEIKDCLLP